MGEAVASCTGSAPSAPASTACAFASASPKCSVDMAGSALAAAAEGGVALSQLGGPSLALPEGEPAS